MNQLNASGTVGLEGAWSEGGRGDSGNTRRGAVENRNEAALRGDTGAEVVIFSVICLLAATLPNDSLFGAANSSAKLQSGFESAFRSPSWYVGIGATVLSVGLLPRQLFAMLRSRAFLLMGASYTMALVVLGVLLSWTGEAIPPLGLLDRPFKSMYMCALFMVLAAKPLWRRRLLLSYLGGWYFFVVVSLFLLFTGRGSEATSVGLARTSLMGMNENVQAVMAGSGMILLVGETINYTRIWHAVLSIGGILAGSLVFIVAASRTGLVGVLAALLCVAVLSMNSSQQKQGWYRILRFVAIGSIVVTVVLWFGRDSEQLGRATETLASRADLAISGKDRGARDTLAAQTLELAWENPLGIGLGRSYVILGMDPHNGYLRILSEGGVVAAAALVAAYWLLMGRALLLSRKPNEIGTIGAFLVFAIAALAGQALVESPYWFFFAFLAQAPRATVAAAAGRVVGNQGR